MDNRNTLSCQMENDEIGTDMLCKVSCIDTPCTIYAFYKFLLALYLSFSTTHTINLYNRRNHNGILISVSEYASGGYLR